MATSVVRPEETVLYPLVQEHWPRLLERAEEQGGGLPQCVVREFEEFLRCGRIEHGLVRLECGRCGHDIVCAFHTNAADSVPRAWGGECPIAAHLVDEVLPSVPIRQWVCSLPWRLRYAAAYDRQLCSDVLEAFIGALTRSQRWRAKRMLGLASVDDALVGAVTFIQRADSSLRLNVHFHTVALDGVYVRDAQGQLVFRALPEPSADEVAQVAEWTHAALLRVLEGHGRSLEGDESGTDVLRDEGPALASCYAASAADVQLLGSAPGQRTSKLVRPLRIVPSPTEPLAEVGGVNVHAKVAFDGRDRQRLERSCRSIARPPLAGGFSRGSFEVCMPTCSTNLASVRGVTRGGALRRARASLPRSPREPPCP